MTAFEFTDFSKATTIVFTNSLLITLLSWIMLGEQISKWDVCGIVFGFIGMVMVMQPYKQRGDEGLSDLFGCFLAFIAAVLSALATIYV